jgi:hypothetical protein
MTRQFLIFLITGLLLMNCKLGQRKEFKDSLQIAGDMKAEY